MTGKNYLHFSAEDFASDSYFQKWILENDPRTSLFWEKWLADNPEKKTEIELAKSIIGQFNFKKYEPSEDDFNEVWKNIKETRSKDIGFPKFTRKRYIGTAAAIVLLISSSIFLSKKSNDIDENDIQAVAPVDNIQTGTDKAVLTLADGSDIKLVKGETYKTANASSDGKEIVYNANSTNEEIAYNYLTIPRGGGANFSLNFPMAPKFGLILKAV